MVSDGTEVTVTDAAGIYELRSAKRWGYVFISVPSGYEAPADGVRPLFYQRLLGASHVVERKDFTLTRVDGQDDFTLFLLGDMHLANRTATPRSSRSSPPTSMPIGPPAAAAGCTPSRSAT